MLILDPQNIPLTSINLIEASAGTGKSWTVTLLYLRLILERKLTVDQILVVTFTDAATKELRDDIRNRLMEALSAFETKLKTGYYSVEDEYHELINKSSNIEQSIKQLIRAKLTLDEAAIFTIHSFCQRTLNENAFEAGLPFESELMDNDQELMLKLTEDFWRRNFYKAPPALLFKLQQKKITPDSLLKDIKLATGKPYLTTCGPTTPPLSNEKWIELEQCFQQAINTWKRDIDEITRLLSQTDLDENGYLAAFKNARDFLLKEISVISSNTQTPAKIDSKLAWLGTKPKTKKNVGIIEHSFFQEWQNFLDCWNEVNSNTDDFISLIRIDLLKYLQTELPLEKRRLGLLSFDDLLLQLQQALDSHSPLNKNSAEILANNLRHQYPVALIDEFQDTDPIQYQIFNAIYGDVADSTVFLVGDPKQAIYSFRGGDIHTYLKAKANSKSENHYTLTKNWRSHPDLINAFNTLYLSSNNPFQDSHIHYIEIESGDKVNEKLQTPDNRKALRFWQINQNDRKPTSTQLRSEVAVAVAGDICELLNAAKIGNAKIGESPISGGDIAILVRSHTQGDLIKTALSEKGVASVQSSKENIFETHEALEIGQLLIAIIEPQNEDYVRRAIVTELMGKNAQDLIAYETDSVAWEQQLVLMQNWHFMWNKQGFLPMFRDLMREQNMHQHLMSFEDGERRLTNVLQLAEIIHHHSHKHALGMKEVLRWFQQRNLSAKESELRLESDQNLVKIVTIHKSKGLEYPIVYCPFMGIGSQAKSSEIYTFHKDGKAYLEIGSENSALHKSLKQAEERAEESRLLYVALTRAKYHCTVVCVPDPIYRTPDRTALGWLLTNGSSIQSGNSKAAKENNQGYYDSYHEKLISLSEHSNIDVIALPDFKKSLRYLATESEQSLTARTFTATIKAQSQVTSFSGLTAGSHNESPDHDAQTNPVLLPIIREDEFPRGATAGSALHEVFENIDFAKPLKDQDEIISGTLTKWGFEEKYHPSATKLIEQCVNTELFAGFHLNQLANKKRLNEMEFYLPLEHLQTEDIKQILYKHLPADWQVIRDAAKTLSFEQVEGYLKGFIDLIFEHEGKYYVVDYKSNSLSDYSQENLLTVMADSHYYLQYLLYSVALHRYLKKRINDYQWETHSGGAYYLFIRGMKDNEDGKNNPKSLETEKSIKSGGGVFFNKPDLALIEALDQLFMASLI